MVRLRTFSRASVKIRVMRSSWEFPRCNAMGKSRDEKYFARIRVFYFLPRAIAGDIDVPATGIERTKDISGFAGHRLGGGILSLSGDIPRRAGRGSRPVRHGSRGRARRGTRPRQILSRHIAALRFGGRWRDRYGSARCRDSVRRRCRRSGCRRRILLSVNLTANKICRCIQHTKGGVRHLTGRSATA